jgi:hypothetical protein
LTTNQLAEARIDLRSRAGEWCYKISTVFLFGFALAAPHSIAGSQGGFLLSALFWLISCALTGRINIKRTPVDLPLIALFGWATLSAFFSYEPYSSLKGLKGLAFFTVLYFITTRASEWRMARRLALTLILSCLVNVGLTVYQKAIGQGLRVDSMTPRSRLIRVGMMQGDVLLQADGKPLNSLDELSNLVDSGPRNSIIKLSIRRQELFFTLDMTRKRIQKVKNATGPARFGIEVSRARDFRAHGFYNHYATYAEVLQLIASLAFGFLLTCPRRPWLMIGLGVMGILFIFALSFTATRAPLIGLIVSLVSMILMTRGFRRVAAIGLIVAALPVGIYSITKWRGVDFFDTSEGSTAWRLQVWREGLGLCLKDPIFGIGKGSERKHWQEWGLFQNGKLPPGHFHSTPLQVAVWWGIPALLFYIAVMFLALRSLARSLLEDRESEEGDWQDRAIVLGAFGGLIGFNFSSLVHFNFGDGEVVMVLWLILGLAMAIISRKKAKRDVRVK